MTAVLEPRPGSLRPGDCDGAAQGNSTPPLGDVVGAGIEVPLHDGTRTRYTNLDYAASAPALQSVYDEVNRVLPQYASVHRGAGYLSQVTTTRYEQARAEVAQFVRARRPGSSRPGASSPADYVIFTRNTTDAINLLAHATPGETVVLDIEHHANLLPWKRSGARIVGCLPTLKETLAALEAELARTPAALLAVTGASNVTGEVLPIAALAAIAHRHGARILVDAAQLAPHRAINIVSLGIDYLVFSGHKLYAPFGCGVLVGRGDWLDAAPPYLAGGGATADVTEHADEVQWFAGPARHEAGSPNVLGALSIAAACRAITAIGHDRIGVHEHRLLRLLDNGLDELPAVRRLRIWSDSTDRVGIGAFVVDGHAPREVAERLSDDQGIGVRDGRFCAHPLLRHLGEPDGAIRASFGLGTGSADLERLLDALRTLIAA